MSIEDFDPQPGEEATGAPPADSETIRFQPEARNFDEKKGTLLLDIAAIAVDLSAGEEMARQNGMEAKTEFHVTVLGFKNGSDIKKVLKKMPEAEQQIVMEKIRSLVEETDWSFSLEPKKERISKEYATKDPKDAKVELKTHRDAYIQKLDMPGMRSFYEKLNALLGTDLQIPPAHITLFTGGDDKDAKMGIGINSESELEKMNPEPLPF